MDRRATSIRPSRSSVPTTVIRTMPSPLRIWNRQLNQQAESTNMRPKGGGGLPRATSRAIGRARASIRSVKEPPPEEPGGLRVPADGQGSPAPSDGPG